jgi:hypothetical protein
MQAQPGARFSPFVTGAPIAPRHRIFQRPPSIASKTAPPRQAFSERSHMTRLRRCNLSFQFSRLSLGRWGRRWRRPSALGAPSLTVHDPSRRRTHFFPGECFQPALHFFKTNVLFDDRQRIVKRERGGNHYGHNCGQLKPARFTLWRSRRMSRYRVRQRSVPVSWRARARRGLRPFRGLGWAFV